MPRATPRPARRRSARFLLEHHRHRHRRSVATSAIYIERALINPSGPDAGREVVVLASLVDERSDAHELAAVDKNARVTAINATIGPGQSILAHARRHRRAARKSGR